MSKMIQIRNVPDEIHREVKVRAAKLGLSMSEYLLREVRNALECPTREELIERLESREPVELETPPAEILREEREQR